MTTPVKTVMLNAYQLGAKIDAFFKDDRPIEYTPDGGLVGLIHAFLRNPSDKNLEALAQAKDLAESTLGSMPVVEDVQEEEKATREKPEFEKLLEGFRQPHRSHNTQDKRTHDLLDVKTIVTQSRQYIDRKAKALGNNTTKRKKMIGQLFVLFYIANHKNTIQRNIRLPVYNVIIEGQGSKLPWIDQLRIALVQGWTQLKKRVSNNLGMLIVFGVAGGTGVGCFVASYYVGFSVAAALMPVLTNLSGIGFAGILKGLSGLALGGVNAGIGVGAIILLAVVGYAAWKGAGLIKAGFLKVVDFFNRKSVHVEITLPNKRHKAFDLKLPSKMRIEAVNQLLRQKCQEEGITIQAGCLKNTTGRPNSQISVKPDTFVSNLTNNALFVDARVSLSVV